MNIQGLANVIRRNTKQNGPALLSAGACVGVVAIVYSTIKSTIKAVKKYDEWAELNGISERRQDRIFDCIRVCGPCYITPVTFTTLTIGAIVCAHKTGSNRATAAIASGAIIQKAFDEYKEKVIEKVGEKGHQTILGKIAEDHVRENPPPGKDVIIAGSGHVLCCELYTGRYFNSDVETLKKAQNMLNQKVLSQDYQTLADFQYMIGLTPTTNSNNVGWTSSRLMELEISAILTHDDRPCLAFDYNYTVPV